MKSKTTQARLSRQHTSLFGIDRLRRGMIAAGVPSEHAAVAAGMAAEYASNAYKHGYDRGFLVGIDWQKARMPNVKLCHEAGQKGQNEL